jgi:calcineurin-like phosphoesterase family protein
MSLRIVSRVTACALALAVCAGVARSADRDWKAHPAIVQVDTIEHVFAVGDPHADWQRLAKVLAAAKLAAPKPASPGDVKWTGSKSVLVITGDLIDKGPSSLGVIELLQVLQGQAAAAGGRVIITMGNHEAQFLAHPDKSPFRKELDKAVPKQDPAKVANCEGAIGEFLCALPIAARVNDGFFSHGGNTGNRSMAKIARDIEDGFKQNQFKTEQLIGPDSILEARLNKKGPNQLPWIYDGSPSTDAKALLARYVAALNPTGPKVGYLVQGHQYESVAFLDGVTRDAGHFFQRFGLLFLEDTGMSQDISQDIHESNNSGGGALHFFAGAGGIKKVTVICPNGEESILWNQDMMDHQEQFCVR